MLMKEIERRLLSELVKNSRRSDRELAKAIGTSQPTATRIRLKLEKEGCIRQYTAIPNFVKIGYTILALHFIKLDLRMNQTQEELNAFKETHYEALNRNPNAVVLVKRGRGLGYDAVSISLHEDYTSCCSFQNLLREAMSKSITDMDVFLINLQEEKTSLPFDFSMLANQLLLLNYMDEK
jgi:DNA-binding Lrp family transcriptional regulator